MISRVGTTVLAVAVTGCGSTHHPAHHPVRTASPSPARSAAVSSRYAAARQSQGLRIVRPPARLGIHQTRLVNLLPDSFPVGEPRTATVGEIDVRRRLPPVGVTVDVAHAAFACGTPFLATPGHAYRVRCTITAHAPGTVNVTLTEHNARTGAAGSRYTAHAPAR